MLLKSIAMVATGFGPCTRWVSVFLALQRSVVTVVVERVSPLLTENFVVSGLWFHSQAGPREVPEKLSVPVQDGTEEAESGIG